MNTSFDFQKWRNHFARNRENRPEPEWNAPIALDPSVIRPLLKSLEEFQLGDGGGPASLIAFDAEMFRNSSAAVRELVDAWFQEEREHSRLLGCAVDRFKGLRIRSHWSFTAFCLCRRLIGVRGELQVLLLTEIVSSAYYRLLRRRVDDPAVVAMCALILRDEAGHIAFHRDRLMSTGRTLSDLRGWLWATQFWLFGHAAATTLWASHRGCLKAIGGSRTEFFREVRQELFRFLSALDLGIEPAREMYRPAVLT